MTAPPQLSVVLIVRGGRHRVDFPLAALERQRDASAFEVILVDSGDDGCDEYVRERYPWVDVVTSAAPLRPGPARNVGIRRARGAAIAFLPDDAQPGLRWVARRAALHARGFDCVGGAVVSARRGPVALAEHLREYPQMVPIQAVLDAQAIPHSLSYARSVFDRVGDFPEDIITGEDTLLNRRCIAAGMAITCSPDIVIRHRGSTTLAALVTHAYGHGRGLVQCGTRQGLVTGISSATSVRDAAWQSFCRYPVGVQLAMVRRMARHAPGFLPVLFVLAPLVWLGLLATGAGAFVEWCSEWDAGRGTRDGASVEPARVHAAE